ncbi:MAG TPA: hypothetical protein PKM41_04430 [Deltaproteobacteria bacterium]|nr:hypothetical protein [Deltaproteobacteria bacterium]HOI05596.1 hypothetical protein [Deltaproteobacteria bacterium]
MMRDLSLISRIKWLGTALCIAGAMLVVDTGAWTCDVAVVSGRVTTNGRPLIWKNRDCSANWRQQIKYFEASNMAAGGYVMVFDFDAFALMNNGSPINPSGGLNESGFVISCTSVYEEFDQLNEALNINTELIRASLSQCVTLADFEYLLKIWPQVYPGKILSGNFVAIDAHGGAALYEVYIGSRKKGSPVKYYRFDANNGSVVDYLGNVIDPGQGDAFIGYVNRTNANTFIAYNYGEERRWRATMILDDLIEDGRMNYYTVMQEVAKDVVGSQAYNISTSDTNYSTTYCISRAATRLGMVVNGVPAGDDPRKCVFWCALGEPSCAVFLPFFPAAREVSELAYVDNYGLDGTTPYDMFDTCILNRAFNRREAYEKLIYDSNTGNALTGMDDKTINKRELAKIQQWTIPLENFIVGKTEQYLAYLRDNPELMTGANLSWFSNYCAEYCLVNYSQADDNAVPWTFPAVPTGGSPEDWIDEIFSNG